MFRVRLLALYYFLRHYFRSIHQMRNANRCWESRSINGTSVVTHVAVIYFGHTSFVVSFPTQQVDIIICYNIPRVMRHTTGAAPYTHRRRGGRRASPAADSRRPSSRSSGGWRVDEERQISSPSSPHPPTQPHCFLLQTHHHSDDSRRPVTPHRRWNMTLDGWMDGWTDGRMDGWTDGRMDGWTDGRMDGWIWFIPMDYI